LHIAFCFHHSMLFSCCLHKKNGTVVFLSHIRQNSVWNFFMDFFLYCGWLPVLCVHYYIMVWIWPYLFYMHVITTFYWEMHTIFAECHDCTTAEIVGHCFHHEGLGSKPALSKWDVWWTEWNWDRIFSWVCLV